MELDSFLISAILGDHHVNVVGGSSFHFLGSLNFWIKVEFCPVDIGRRVMSNSGLHAPVGNPVDEASE